MSQGELARALTHGRYGNRYSASYISKLESGAAPITDEVLRAIADLDTDTRHLTVLPPGVYATSALPPGTVILGRVVICGGCGHPFVMPYATQRYCSRDCRNTARRMRRKEQHGDRPA